MSYIPYNTNPIWKRTNDCTVRAISMVTNKPWRRVFYGMCAMGGDLYSMPSANEVWGEYLNRIGYKRGVIPNTCPYCYTVRDFCRDNPYGRFVLGTGNHVIAVINGHWYDTWDSGDEVPIFYWWKG